MKLNWAEKLAVNNPLRPWEQRLELDWLVKTASPAPGARILEIGCGRGAGAGLLLRRFSPSSLWAMDLDGAMIAKAARRLAAERRRVVLLAADASRIPCRAGAFDNVFGFGVLHHIPDWRAAMAEIARVLRPGGLYFFEELYPSLYQNFITRRLLLHPAEGRFRGPDLRDALASLGIPLVSCVERSWLGILGVSRKSC